jgi:hypothetical protein
MCVDTTKSAVLTDVYRRLRRKSIFGKKIYCKISICLRIPNKRDPKYRTVVHTVQSTLATVYTTKGVAYFVRTVYKKESGYHSFLPTVL